MLQSSACRGFRGNYISSMFTQNSLNVDEDDNNLQHFRQVRLGLLDERSCGDVADHLSFKRMTIHAKKKIIMQKNMQIVKQMMEDFGIGFIKREWEPDFFEISIDASKRRRLKKEGGTIPQTRGAVPQAGGV